MSYDPNVPRALKTLQTWFAGIITRPIDQKSRICPITPNGKSIEKEAPTYIKASRTLKPEQRIEIYNQQYWWRLLNVLHSTFGMATRMLGYKKFNQSIALPYLQAYPSTHYSVSHIGDHLHEWMLHAYSGESKKLLTDAIAIDLAMDRAFFRASLPPITVGRSPEEAFAHSASLQPHITLFKMDCNLFQFRSEIEEKDPDYWSSHHYPNLEHALMEDGGHFPKLQQGKVCCFIVYRNRLNAVCWKEIPSAEHALLSQFQQTASIEKVCEWLSNQPQQLVDEAIPNLEVWIQRWIAKQLLVSASNHSRVPSLNN